MTINKIDQSFVGSKSIFYIDGEIAGGPGAHHMKDQMFVEAYFPREQLHPWPVVMFHGAGQTNMNWLMTPDGRMGWADYFVSRGFAVYLCEQPSRGRSAYHPEDNGPRRYHTLESLQRFTSNNGSWPQSALHTQWPGSGDPEFSDETDRQFYAAQVEFLQKDADIQRLVKKCGLKLLETIGPAILLTHSQAGPFGWILADEAPELVKGIVALEPSGPVFSNDTSLAKAKNFGLTELPLHFEPPVKSPEEFRLKLLKAPAPGLNDGWILAEPGLNDAGAHAEPVPKLPRLAKVPVWIITSEASYHAGYDHLISTVLTQCGVTNTFIRLEERGIHGNGHMMMLEKNNLQIADLIIQLIS